MGNPPFSVLQKTGRWRKGVYSFWQTETNGTKESTRKEKEMRKEGFRNRSSRIKKHFLLSDVITSDVNKRRRKQVGTCTTMERNTEKAVVTFRSGSFYVFLLQKGY